VANFIGPCTQKSRLWPAFVAIPIGAASLVLFFTLSLGLFCFSLWLGLSFRGCLFRLGFGLGFGFGFGFGFASIV
jgi:hypothetical protein